MPKLIFILLFPLLLIAHDGHVVLVHGFMRSSLNMGLINHYLKKDGWQTTNWSYPSRDKIIEEHAQDLCVYLKEIAKQQPGKPIHFVTHSMGGLVVRTALNQTDCPNEAKIGRAVLIAPPNRGSEFARTLNAYAFFRRVMGPNAGKQLMTTEWDGFDSLGSFPNSKKILVIAGTSGINPLITGTNDGKVSVDETSLPTPHIRVQYPAGHSWICYSPTVAKKVCSFLPLLDDRGCEELGIWNHTDLVP